MVSKYMFVLRCFVVSLVVCLPAWAGPISYDVTVDTSAYEGSFGTLGFLLTDWDGNANTKAEIYDASGVSEALLQISSGDVEGSLLGGLTMGDGQWLPVSSYFELGVMFSNQLSYTLAWDTTSSVDTFTAVLINSPLKPLYTVSNNGAIYTDPTVTISPYPGPVAVSEGMAAELPLFLVGLGLVAFWHQRFCNKPV